MTSERCVFSASNVTVIIAEVQVWLSYEERAGPAILLGMRYNWTWAQAGPHVKLQRAQVAAQRPLKSPKGRGSPDGYRRG